MTVCGRGLNSDSGAWKSFPVDILVSPSLVVFVFEVDLDGYLFTHTIRCVNHNISVFKLSHGTCEFFFFIQKTVDAASKRNAA